MTEQIRGPGVRLAGAANDNERRVWVEVARAGVYQGYSPPFVLDRSVFEACVANIRRHPAFRLGSSGYGEADVVPWDDNGHGTERVGVSSPAVGWSSDFRVATAGDGTVVLEAYTRWLPATREQIREGAFRWASVALGFDSVDPISGQNVGAAVSSISLTNVPFIQSLAPVAASRVGGSAEGASNVMTLNISSAVGRNRTERVISVLTSIDASFAQRPWLEQVSIASRVTLANDAEPAAAPEPKPVAGPGRNPLESKILELRASRPSFRGLTWELQVEQASAELRAGAK